MVMLEDDSYFKRWFVILNHRGKILKAATTELLTRIRAQYGNTAKQNSIELYLHDVFKHVKCQGNLDDYYSRMKWGDDLL